MSKVTIPAGYKTPLSTYEMQRAIEFIKSNFQVNLGQALNLRRVSAPLFVDENSGLNDNLNGVERPVSFDIPDVGAQGQVVHSLAKWKRLALKRYDFKPGKGLFTDMNAIRRDEEVDNLHSIYVDQWDWEKVIERRDRTVDFLEQTVRAIVGAVVETNDALQIAFPSLHTVLDREVYFVTTQELEDRWPDYTPKQREDGAGMHDDVINTILFAEPERIVYVSCNPATQARDLSLLSVKYSVKKVRPVDMFPHTHHVENVVLLEKK